MHGVPPPYSRIPLCYGALLTKRTTLPLSPLPYQHLNLDRTKCSDPLLQLKPAYI